MKELSNEKLIVSLDVLWGCYMSFVGTINPIEKQAYIQLRKRLEEKPKVTKEFINEKAKWIYENSICLDSGVHKIRHPIAVKASISFVKQMLKEIRVGVEEANAS